MNLYKYLFGVYKYYGVRSAFMMHEEGFGKVMVRVEGITLEAKALTLLYQPLGFWLQLVSEIIKKTP